MCRLSSRRARERCHRTVMAEIPSSDAMAGTDKPSSSCITSTARRRGASACSASQTETCSTYRDSGLVAGPARSLGAARRRTASARHWSRRMLTRTRTSHASSAWPDGTGEGDVAALRNVSCTRSHASSAFLTSRRARRYSRPRVCRTARAGARVAPSSGVCCHQGRCPYCSLNGSRPGFVGGGAGRMHDAAVRARRGTDALRRKSVGRARTSRGRVIRREAG